MNLFFALLFSAALALAPASATVHSLFARDLQEHPHRDPSAARRRRVAATAEQRALLLRGWKQWDDPSLEINEKGAIVQMNPQGLSAANKAAHQVPVKITTFTNDTTARQGTWINGAISRLGEGEYYKQCWPVSGTHTRTEYVGTIDKKETLTQTYSTFDVCHALLYVDDMNREMNSLLKQEFGTEVEFFLAEFQIQFDAEWWDGVCPEDIQPTDCMPMGSARAHFKSNSDFASPGTINYFVMNGENWYYEKYYAGEITSGVPKLGGQTELDMALGGAHGAHLIVDGLLPRANQVHIHELLHLMGGLPHVAGKSCAEEGPYDFGKAVNGDNIMFDCLRKPTCENNCIGYWFCDTNTFLNSKAYDSGDKVCSYGTDSGSATPDAPQLCCGTHFASGAELAPPGAQLKPAASEVPAWTWEDTPNCVGWTGGCPKLPPSWNSNEEAELAKAKNNCDNCCACVGLMYKELDPSQGGCANRCGQDAAPAVPVPPPSQMEPIAFADGGANADYASPIFWGPNMTCFLRPPVYSAYTPSFGKMFAQVVDRWLRTNQITPKASSWPGEGDGTDCARFLTEYRCLENAAITGQCMWHAPTFSCKKTPPPPVDPSKGLMIPLGVRVYGSTADRIRPSDNTWTFEGQSRLFVKLELAEGDCTQAGHLDHPEWHVEGKPWDCANAAHAKVWIQVWDTATHALLLETENRVGGGLGHYIALLELPYFEDATKSLWNATSGVTREYTVRVVPQMLVSYSGDAKQGHQMETPFVGGFTLQVQAAGSDLNSPFCAPNCRWSETKDSICQKACYVKGCHWDGGSKWCALELEEISNDDQNRKCFKNDFEWTDGNGQQKTAPDDGVRACQDGEPDKFPNGKEHYVCGGKAGFCNQNVLDLNWAGYCPGDGGDANSCVCHHTRSGRKGNPSQQGCGELIGIECSAADVSGCPCDGKGCDFGYCQGSGWVTSCPTGSNKECTASFAKPKANCTDITDQKTTLTCTDVNVNDDGKWLMCLSQDCKQEWSSCSTKCEPGEARTLLSQSGPYGYGAKTCADVAPDCQNGEGHCVDVDCVGTFSECTCACESVWERTFTMTHAPKGAGQCLAVGNEAMNGCKPGMGACTSDSKYDPDCEQAPTPAREWMKHAHFIGKYQQGGFNGEGAEDDVVASPTPSSSPAADDENATPSSASPASSANEKAAPSPSSAVTPSSSSTSGADENATPSSASPASSANEKAAPSPSSAVTPSSSSTGGADENATPSSASPASSANGKPAPSPSSAVTPSSSADLLFEQSLSLSFSGVSSGAAVTKAVVALSKPAGRKRLEKEIAGALFGIQEPQLFASWVTVTNVTGYGGSGRRLPVSPPAVGIAIDYNVRIPAAKVKSESNKVLKVMTDAAEHVSSANLGGRGSELIFVVAVITADAADIPKSSIQVSVAAPSQKEVNARVINSPSSRKEKDDGGVIEVSGVSSRPMYCAFGILIMAAALVSLIG